MSNEIQTAQAAIRAMDEAEAAYDATTGKRRKAVNTACAAWSDAFDEAAHASIAAIRALPSAEPVFQIGLGWLIEFDRLQNGTLLYTAPPVVEIDEAMVTRACNAYDKHMHPSFAAEYPAMHDALTAALGEPHDNSI